MNTDTHMNGSTVKNHILLNTVFGYSATQRTSFRSWFLVYQRVLPQACLLQHPWDLKGRKLIIPNLPQARLPQHTWHLQRRLIIQITFQQPCQVKVWKDKYGETRILLKHQKSCWMNQPEHQKTKKNMRITSKYGETRIIPTHRNGCKISERILWMTEFLNADSHASSSHELSLEPTRSVDLNKHSVYTHFPKDRTCEICQRTKITRVPRRRRFCRGAPRAENFGFLIKADHKVLSEGCESRNSRRYAVVVQDLATQWIQSYPCKTKTSQETQRSLHKFLEPNRKPKSHLHWQFPGIWQSLWRSFLESLYVNNTQIGNKWDCWESSTQSERRYICSIVAIRSGWKSVGGFYGMLYLSAKHSRSLVWWENSIRKAFWRTISRTNHSVWFIGWVLPYLCERPVKNPSIWKESLMWIVPRIRFVRGRNLEGWHFGCRPWGVGNDGRIGNLLEKTFWRRSGTENTHLDTGTPNSRRRSKGFSWRIRRVCSATSRLVSGCRWSYERLLVHVGKLHIPPSRWTQSRTLLAERRIIPFSTEMHWRLQNYADKLGCYARKPHRWLLEYRWVKRFVWFLDRFHSVNPIKWETSKRIYVVREKTDEKAANIKARPFMARTLDEIEEKC